MTYKQRPGNGGVTVTYIKRRSSAVCGGCDWSAVSDGTEGAELNALRKKVNSHAATMKHRVIMTLTQDVFVEARLPEARP